MFVQMSIFFDNFFSNENCGFQKVHKTQYCLLVILETWKRFVKFFVFYYQTFQRHLIISTMNYFLRKYIYMVLVCPHYDPLTIAYQIEIREPKLRTKCPNTEFFLVHKVTIKNANFFVLIVSWLRTHHRNNLALNN